MCCFKSNSAFAKPTLTQQHPSVLPVNDVPILKPGPDSTHRPKQTNRQPIHPAIRFEIRMRDGHCTEILLDGSRCTSRKDLEIHHIVEVSEGGTDSFENLKLLCRAHHQAQHANFNFTERPKYRQWVRESTLAYN